MKLEAQEEQSRQRSWQGRGINNIYKAASLKTGRFRLFFCSLYLLCSEKSFKNNDKDEADYRDSKTLQS
jgi:hypothetical protein